MIFLEKFFNQPILSTIMQSLALGITTVTIAIIIFLTDKGGVFPFDRQVIVRKIIPWQPFIFFLVFLFLPLFLWDFGDFSVRSALLLSYTAAVVGFMIFIQRSFKWFDSIETENKRVHTSYRQQKRLEYLKDISPDPQKLLVWEYIWQIEGKQGVEEREYVEKFIDNISSFLERGDEKSATGYLYSLERLIENITLQDPVILDNFLKKLLWWHYKVSSSYKTSEENKRRYMHLLSILERLIGLFVKRGLTLGALYIVFETLKNFIAERTGEEYIKLLIATTAHVFFEHVADSPESHTIWSHYFPQEWKVTKATIEDRQNLMAKLWLHHFLRWAQQRIWKHHSKDAEWDKQLDNISEGLFPSADPPTWAVILTFLMRPWGNNERLKDLVEISRKFGLASRMSIMSYDDSEESRGRMFEELGRRINEQRDNAIELALIIFKGVFTKEKLQEHIRELEQLQYAEDSRESKYRDQIKRIFEDMLNRLSNGQANNNN